MDLLAPDYRDIRLPSGLEFRCNINVPLGVIAKWQAAKHISDYETLNDYIESWNLSWVVDVMTLPVGAVGGIIGGIAQEMKRSPLAKASSKTSKRSPSARSRMV